MITGLKAAVLHPMTTIRMAAVSFTFAKVSAAMETPPSTGASSAMRSILDTDRVRTSVIDAAASSIPRPNADQRNPSQTEPASTLVFTNPGSMKTKALAPRF